MFVNLTGNRVTGISTGDLDVVGDNQIVIDLKTGENLGDYKGLFFNPADSKFYHQYSVKTGEYLDPYVFETEEEKNAKIIASELQKLVDSGILTVEAVPLEYQDKIVVPELEVVEPIEETPTEELTDPPL